MVTKNSSMVADIHISNPASAPTRGMFRALWHRNFRIIWLGAVLSNVGTWMQTLAQGYLVYELTRSSWWLGVDGFMATAPSLVLTLLGGVLADLIDRRRLLILTQTGAGLSALVLAALVYTHTVQVWMILGLSFVTGCCMSLAGPSFQAMTLDLAGREDLSNAIALNSAQFQLSRVIGPALAGLFLAVWGTAACFFANSLSFVAVIIALCAVRLPDKANPLTKGATRQRLRLRALWDDLTAGFRYVRQRPRVFWLLLVATVNTFFGAAYLSQLPLFARDVWHAGETGLSFLMAASGAGAFSGALLLAFADDFRRKGRAVLIAAFIFGLGVVGFASSPRWQVALLFLFVMGMAGVGAFAVTNTLVQQLVTDEMRGRVMSMLILTFVGVMPFSSLAVGALAKQIGAPHTLALGGIVIMLFSILVALTNKKLRDAA